MEKTYYIYHIPGVKYGCTQNYPERPASQSEVYELTEMHTDIMIASKREKELNIAAGYPWSDTQYYYKMVEYGKKVGSIQGKKNVESGHWSKLHSIGGLAAKEVGAQSKAGKIGGKSPNNPTQQIVTCPHCGRIGQKAGLSQKHFDRCKLKPISKN